MTPKKDKLVNLQLSLSLWARKQAPEIEHEVEDKIHDIMYSFSGTNSKIKKLQALAAEYNIDNIQEQSLTEYTNQSELNPNVWIDSDTMKPAVRKALYTIAKTFWSEFDCGYDYTDITLTGSSANYNWTEYSDIDLHILVNTGEIENVNEFTKMATYFRSQWNSKHNLKIRNNFIELYIQDSSEPHSSTGVYSIIKGKWIIKPEFTNITIDDSDIENKAMPFVHEIEKLENDLRTGNTDLMVEYIDQLRERIRHFRKSGLSDAGEYSIENMAFKYLRNNGWLERLSNLRIFVIDSNLVSGV